MWNVNTDFHSDATSKELKAGSVNSSTIFMPWIVSSYRDEDYEQDYEPRLSFVIVGFKSDVILIFGGTLLYLWKDRYSCNLVHVLVYCNIFLFISQVILYLLRTTQSLDKWCKNCTWRLRNRLDRVAQDRHRSHDEKYKEKFVFQLQLCALQYSPLGRVHADTLFSGKQLLLS